MLTTLLYLIKPLFPGLFKFAVVPGHRVGWRPVILAGYAFQVFKETYITNTRAQTGTTSTGYWESIQGGCNGKFH